MASRILKVSERPQGETPRFMEFNPIGKFGTDAHMEYFGDNQPPEIPLLIPQNEIDSLQGTSLRTGYETAVLIPDYKIHKQTKNAFLLKWIIETDYFRKVQENVYKKPDIICFAGTIRSSMKTPLVTRHGDWEIYAAKYLDTVFIWKDRNWNTPKNIPSYYCGFSFKCLMTGVNPAASVECAKSHMIQEVTFGEHQLLIVGGIDAQDDQEKFIEFKTCTDSRERSPLGLAAKYLALWAQAEVHGVEKCVVGQRDAEGILIETEILSTEQVLENAGQNHLTISKCYRFENRLLKWIRSHFQENNPKCVKKFSWAGIQNVGDTSPDVYCSDVPEMDLPIGGIFPDWFIEN